MNRIVQLVLLPLLSSPAWAAITMVQSHGVVVGSATSVTNTFSSNTATHSLLIACIDFDDTSTFGGISDSQGNAFTQFGIEVDNTSAAVKSRCYYSKNIVGGAPKGHNSQLHSRSVRRGLFCSARSKLHRQQYCHFHQLQRNNDNRQRDCVRICLQHCHSHSGNRVHHRFNNQPKCNGAQDSYSRRFLHHFRKPEQLRRWHPHRRYV
jgi:hypothetical protein